MVAQLETPVQNSACPLPYTVEGLVQVFTSQQRNFLTDVMAQALRIAGQGTPVLVVQFLKGGIAQSYRHPLRLGQNLDWIRCELSRNIDQPPLEEAETQAILDLWDSTCNAVFEGQYSLVVLDELSLAMNFGAVEEAKVLDFLDRRPRHVDLILTGPQMPESILNLADRITEIRRTRQP
jgi:cob(I)alamin adenosyltransferase